MSDLDLKGASLLGISSALEAYFTIKYLPVLLNSSPTSLPLFPESPSDYFNIRSTRDTINSVVVAEVVSNFGQQRMSRTSNCNDGSFSEKARASEFDSTVAVTEPNLQHTPTLLSSYVAPNRGIGSFFRTKSGTGNGNSSRDDWQVVGVEETQGGRARGLSLTGVLPAEGMRLGSPFPTTSTSPPASRKNSLNLPPFLQQREQSSSTTGRLSTSPTYPIASTSRTSPITPVGSPTKALPSTPPSRRSSVEQTWSSRSISGTNSSRPPISPTSYSPVATRFRGASSELPRSPSNPQSLYSTKALSTSNSNLNTTVIRPSEERTDSGGSNSTSSSSNSSHRGFSSPGTTNSSNSDLNGGGYGFFKRDNRGSPRRTPELNDSARGKILGEAGIINRSQEIAGKAEDQVEECKFQICFHLGLEASPNVVLSIFFPSSIEYIAIKVAGKKLTSRYTW